MHAEIAKYPEQIRELLTPLEHLHFDFSSEKVDSVQTALNSISLSEMFHQPIADKNMAMCCHSGLWLLHGHLHDSHEISQTIKTREGSYWHAIMHRAEGDFWNSKYWYRQVRNHPVLDQLKSNGVSGEELVDLCEKATGAENLQVQTCELVKMEWTLLFEHCWSQATAS